VRFSRDRLRSPLACVAFGSISIAYYGVHLATPASSPGLLTVGELAGISLPLTVAWFSFSGTCMLCEVQYGLSGIITSGSQLLGQAALLAGIPVWAYWYLHLVFRVI
jgi:hypothetical protein